MKTLFKLSLKSLRRNIVLNIYMIIQMSIVFTMTMFMVSSITSRYKYYNPFKEYIEKGGYFCDLTSATSVLGKYVQKSTDISDALSGVEEGDVQATYRVNIVDKDSTDLFSLCAYCYDRGLYDKWIPEMEMGTWLSELKPDKFNEIPVVVYDAEKKLKIGDIIEKQTIDYSDDNNNSYSIREIRLRVVGILSDDAEIIYYNNLKYDDYRDMYSSVNDITAKEGYDSVYLFRSEDIQYANVFSMSSGVAFINFSKLPSEEQQDDNNIIILGITERFIEMREFQNNSISYIMQEITKLLPIFICILLLAIIISVSINAITTYNEMRNYSIYYICGITWNKSLIISLFYTMIQTILSFSLALVTIILLTQFDVTNNVIIEFHPLQIATCFLVFVINLLFSLIMPYLIIKSNTPKGLLTRN